MKKRLKRMEKHLASIDVTMAKSQVNWEEHVKRTNTLQDLVEMLRNEHAMAKGALKLVGLLGGFILVMKIVQWAWING